MLTLRLIRLFRGRARPAALLLADGGSIAVSLAAAAAVCAKGGIGISRFALLLCALLILRLPSHVVFGLHRWAYRADFRREAARVGQATLLGTLGFAVALFGSRLLPGLTTNRAVALLSVEAALTALLVLLSRSALRRLGARLRPAPEGYDRWVREFDRRDAAGVAARLASLRRRPLVSILVPVYRTHPAFLDRAIASVRAQSYPGWELLLVDDGSHSPEIDALLERHSREEPRVRVDRLPANQGISTASNRALALAGGEFAALLDHDDELAPDALLHLVDAIGQDPRADILYSDEDHIDGTGRRHDPFFKPDWSPDLVLAEDYVCHLMAFRRSLAEECGGFRSQNDGSQDYDLLLRMSRKARAIVHVPRILYHWRTDVEPALSTRVSSQKGKVFASSRRAVEDYLVGSGARVEEGRWPGRWRIRYPIPAGLEVAILVPSVGELGRLRRCLDSIREKTSYPSYRVAVADGSTTAAAEDFLRDWSRRHGRTISYLDWKSRPFDRGAMNNALARKAVAESSSPLLLFLNEATEVLARDWVTSLVELAARPEVGVVGAKLLYPDDRIQHAGVVLGLFGVAGHAFRGCPHDAAAYYDFPDLVRNVSAVSGDCLMIPSALFLDVGGFDDTGLLAPHEDIDLCLRVGQRGRRILYNPYALLRHHDATSQLRVDLSGEPAERHALRTRWAEQLARDPFYNPNLTTTAEDYSFRTSTATSS